MSTPFRMRTTGAHSRPGFVDKFGGGGDSAGPVQETTPGTPAQRRTRMRSSWVGMGEPKYLNALVCERCNHCGPLSKPGLRTVFRQKALTQAAQSTETHLWLDFGSF